MKPSSFHKPRTRKDLWKLANHLAASGFVLPHHIALHMPWSHSPLGDQSITQSEPPAREIGGLTSLATKMNL
jgi:hypothetical protein